MQPQLIISGQVLMDNDDPALYVKIELRDHEQNNLIALTHVDASGQFVLSIAEPASQSITDGSLMPKYIVSLGTDVLFEEEREYTLDEELLFTINTSDYSAALSKIQGLQTVQGQITISGGTADKSQLRAELYDTSGNYTSLIAATNVSASGEFMLTLWEPATAIFNNAQPECRIFLNDKLLISVPVDTPLLDITLGLSEYNSAMNAPSQPLQVPIHGTVLLAEQGTQLQNIQVRLQTGQEFSLGLISEMTTDPGGNFDIQILNTPALWIRSNKVQPTFEFFIGDILLGTQTIDYTAGDPVVLEVDDTTYHAATNGAEAVYDPVFISKVAEISNIRLQRDQVFESLVTAKNQLAIAQGELAVAQEYNGDTGTILVTIDSLNTDIDVFGGEYEGLAAAESDAIFDFYELYPSMIDHVAQLDDRVPVLFFPVRIETTFQKEGQYYQLWVRIFPDDIAVDTNEKSLTADEVSAGQTYWIKVNASGATKADKLQAWDVISRAFSPERAAWIVKNTTASGGLSSKVSPWTKQPLTYILPEAFMIIGYANDNFTNPVFYTQANPIPDTVRMGIDPSNNPVSFSQSGGEIISDQSVSWITDFDAAISKGLGKKILLSEEAYNNGFSRIIVLGVKTTLDKEASRQRLQDLINGHHYTDGFSLLKQGTSTNNTENEYSGYSSVDFGNETTYATEREAQLFTPSPFKGDKTDGQLLCEALGIDYDVLYHIYHSNGRDVIDAMKINNSMFAVTVGNTLNSYWGVPYTKVDELRDFFSEYVRCRGALPSIRSGVQPYGVLPTTVFSRMDWGIDPRRGLYKNVWNVFDAFADTWGQVVADNGAGGNGTGSQQITTVLGKHAVSTNYVWRLGVGPAYVWNNLVYATDDGDPRRKGWLNEQVDRMNVMAEESGLPFSPRPRIAQMNFMEDAIAINYPLVADKSIDKSKPLPELGTSGMNYMRLLSEAKFSELRDQNYTRFGISNGDVPNTLLYQLQRQSLLLEYYDTACKLLNVPDSQRVEPELINILNQADIQEVPQGHPDFKVYAGPSRWALFEQPYEGFATVREFMDSGQVFGMPDAVYLTRARDAVYDLSFSSVKDLSLLTAEVIDGGTFRVDTWGLSLVNQRLNAIRGITDGSLNRNMGIYLGAYGWVEHVHQRGSRAFVAPPAPTSNFQHPIEKDSSNHGYIHAPSVTQAATAAVLRSGFKKYGATANSPFAVNISSQRVRGALQLLDGIRNGQELAVLLGYEFERRLHDLYPFYNSGPSTQNINVDRLLVPLRSLYPLNRVITGVTPTGSANDRSRNVVNGITLIEKYKASQGNEFIALNQALSNLGASAITFSEQKALENEFNWIADLMDAVGDLTTTESVFHLVQGNQTRASAISEAMSRGNDIPEIEHINTPKTGTAVYQRFTMHLENNDSFLSSWSADHTERSKAEPYINYWIGSLLGNPASIKCTVSKAATPATKKLVSLSDLGIQPIDLVFIIQNELKNDDSELPLRIRRHARVNSWAAKAEALNIDYSDPGADPDVKSVITILPMLKYIKEIVVNCRSLKTSDYVSPHDTTAYTNVYSQANFNNRLSTTYTSFSTALANLNPAGTASAMRNALDAVSRFGIEQAIYEYEENTTEDISVLSNLVRAAKTEADARNAEYVKAVAGIGSIVDPDEYISKRLEALKALFGKAFNALPLFELRTSDLTVFAPQLTSSSTLLNDHIGNPYVMDEWVSGISKVRRNAANYELLSILSSVISVDAFVTDRKIIPLQTPYDVTPANKERWMGAKVSDSVASVKPGRVSFGISVPGNTSSYNFSGEQVGFMIDDWIDVIPNKTETTGIAFHFNQPNAKPPQCLLLGLAPRITGHWNWNDMVDMINETFDMAKKRGVTYNDISGTAAAQLASGVLVSVSANNSGMGLTTLQIQP